MCEQPISGLYINIVVFDPLQWTKVDLHPKWPLIQRVFGLVWFFWAFLKLLLFSYCAIEWMNHHFGSHGWESSASCSWIPRALLLYQQWLPWFEQETSAWRQFGAALEFGNLFSGSKEGDKSSPTSWSIFLSSFSVFIWYWRCLLGHEAAHCVALNIAMHWVAFLNVNVTSTKLFCAGGPMRSCLMQIGKIYLMCASELTSMNQASESLVILTPLMLIH